MRPNNRQAGNGAGGGAWGSGGGPGGGSFYSPQQYYGNQYPPRQHPVQPPGGGFVNNNNNGFMPQMGFNGGYGGPRGQDNGWNNQPFGGMAASSRFPQRGGPNYGHGHMGNPQQQRQPHSSYNNDSRGRSHDGGNGFSGPSGSRSHDQQPSRRRSPSPQLSPEESEIRDIVRAVDRDIIERNRQLSLIWSKAHSDALEKLVKATGKAEEPGSKKRAIEPLLEAFALMIECRTEGRLDPSQKSRTGEIKESLVNGIYDLCEDGNDKVRKLGYTAMRDLSKHDPTLLKRNADVLVQLLQNDDPTEHDLISRSLVGHLSQSPLDAFDVIIQDHCKGELRHLALSFLAAPQAEKVLEDKVVGNADREAALALRLADVIPLANDEEMELIKILLRPLSTLWLPSFDFATTEEYENASASASRLLNKLVEGFLVRFRARGHGDEFMTKGAEILKYQSEEIEKVLAGSDLLPPASGSEMQDAHELFKALLEVSAPDAAADATVSTTAAQATYARDTREALLFAHKFLPDSTTTEATAPTLLRHFGGHLRIQLLRFAAEVAARTTEVMIHVESGLEQVDVKSRHALARAAIAAIKAIFPAESDTGNASTAPGQKEAYEILLVEALLAILLHAAPPASTKGRGEVPEIEEQGFNVCLKRLYRASQDIKSSWPGDDAMVKEAGTVVLNITKEYLKPRHNRLAVSIRPTWWQAPPPFPVEAARSKRQRNDDSNDEARGQQEHRQSVEDGGASSKRARPSDVAVVGGKTKPKPRGRGTTQAPSSSGWEEDDLFAHSAPRTDSKRQGGTRGFTSSDPPELFEHHPSSERGFAIKGSGSPDREMARGMSIRGAAGGKGKGHGRGERVPLDSDEGVKGGKGMSIMGAAREKGRVGSSGQGAKGDERTERPIPTGPRAGVGSGDRAERRRGGGGGGEYRGRYRR